jgi:hypothetical protein
LPPIRLESRSQPAPSPLPPIRLVSRAEPAPMPTPSIVHSARQPRRTSPRFQQDATRASTQVRRNFNAFTRWIGQAGAEIQQGVGNQPVNRASGNSGAKVERRDRWSERARP